MPWAVPVPAVAAVMPAIIVSLVVPVVPMYLSSPPARLAVTLFERPGVVMPAATESVKPGSGERVMALVESPMEPLLATVSDWPRDPTPTGLRRSWSAS